MNSDTIARLIEPVLAGTGLELEAVEIQPAGRRSLVRVVLDGDGPDGRGPGVDDIAAASSSISALLDDAPETGDAPYTLEVSTRGVTRPLTAAQHWRRNRGRLVKVTPATATVDPDPDGDPDSATPAGEPVIGRILDSDDEQVRLEVDGAIREIAFAAIGQALVQVEFAKKTKEN